MIAEIQVLLNEVPFHPFSIAMSDGKTYEVPTRDHIFLLPSKVIVKNDAGKFWILAARNMTSLSGNGADDASSRNPMASQG